MTRWETDGFALRFAAATYMLLWPLLWGSGRLLDPVHNAAMGAATAATLALLYWHTGAPRSFQRLRPWAMGVYQAASPALLTVAGFQLQMGSPPTPGFLGATADAVRVLTGQWSVSWSCWLQ